MAAWTGIAAFVGKSESDWLLPSALNQANIDFYGLRIEEKSNVDLRIGARAGQFDLRLFNPLNVNLAEKYDGQFFSLYLRWPLTLTERVKFHTNVSYQLNLGTLSVDSESTEINWNEVSLNLGLSLRLGLISLRPFVDFRSIDGDISSAAQTRIFKQNKVESVGLMLDYFVEHFAFVRLMITGGSNQSMMISFVREH